MLSAVAANVLFTPDLTKLRHLPHIADDRTLKEYLTLLEEAGLKVVFSKSSLEPLRCVRVDAAPERVTLMGTDLDNHWW